MIKDTLINRLHEEFGEPTRTTKKVEAWHITNHFGFVVEVDKPDHGEFANVWLPHPFDSIEMPAITLQVYPQDKGRHSNTYSTPGLQRGEVVLKLKITSQHDIENLVDYLKP
ncbi:hypothetical protein [Photobacterium sp. J15]|uniref:hypothetical protein n=1 Tax=Photobacterium sp. J15 TaxID=265901 RepID=UPI0007E464F2|nr:hypothetical protein [Photobacterium sp. J15]